MSQRAEGFRTKALLYERAANIATNPDVSRVYVELARQLRAMAQQAEGLELTGNSDMASGGLNRSAAATTTKGSATERPVDPTVLSLARAHQKLIKTRFAEQ